MTVLIDSILLHVMLFLAIFGNFILSVVMVPVLIALRGIFLYVCIYIIAMSFGALFSFLLHGIEMAKPSQHLLASILIPSLALINVAIFANLTNKLIVLLHLAEPGHNVILVGLVYVFGYVTPEILTHVLHR